MHRQAELLSQRHHDAAACATVQLGDGKPGHGHHLLEHLNLIQRVLAGGGIQHQQYRMRRRRVLLLEHADDLLQFLHQRRFVVQPPGRVDQQYVRGFRPRLGQRVEGEAGGVGVRRPGDHARAGALAPDLKLLDGGGAERVAGDQHRADALLAVLLRQLADGGGLAAAVDPDHQHDVRVQGAVQHQRLGDRGEDGGDFAGQRLAHLVVRHFAAEARATELGDDAGGNLGTEIGGDQHVLQIRQRRVVQLAADEDGAELVGDLGRAAGQTLLEAGEETERHQAASARTPAASAAVMRARSSVPGLAAMRTGAKCSVCPVPSVSASTSASRPIIPA